MKLDTFTGILVEGKFESWNKVLLCNTGGGTVVKHSEDWSIAENVYFNINKFFAVVDAGETPEECSEDGYKISKQAPLGCIPVISVPGFQRNLNLSWVDGLTLWIDHPDPDALDDVTFWIEIAARTYAKLEDALQHDSNGIPVRSVVLLHVSKKKAKQFRWIKELMYLSIPLNSRIDAAKPPGILFQDDIALGSSNWVGFKQVLHILPDKNRKNGGDFKNVFGSTVKAQEFRKSALKMANVATETEADSVTMLIAPEGGDLFNPQEVLQMLHDVFDGHSENASLYVRPYSATLELPLESIINVMARTKLLIGRHGPLLSYAFLLPPGSAVIELLPYNADGFYSYYLYHDIVRSIGDLTHIAWMGESANSNVYMCDEDQRYATWHRGECYSDECVEAHRLSLLHVNVSELKTIVTKYVDMVSLAPGEGKATVLDESGSPFPPRVERITSTSGLWWNPDE